MALYSLFYVTISSEIQFSIKCTFLDPTPTPTQPTQVQGGFILADTTSNGSNIVFYNTS